MPTRPTVVLAMVPQLTEGMFTPVLLERLRAVADLPDPEPLTTFGEPRATELLARTHVLVTGWGCPPVDSAALALAPQLRAVVHAAGTVKMHITDACWDRGLLITSAAAANALPVAEFTLAAILFANKRVFRLQRLYRQVRSFRWWPAEAPGLGNLGKVVGLVGASMVGRKVIELLRPFELSVQVYDPFLDDTEASTLGVRKVDLDELLRTSDVVSLHAPALPETRHMLDRRRLSLMRDGATLINTARGWLVDGDALERELVSGRIEAVIDTTEPEVLPESSPLYELANVFLTPHIAGAMGTEIQRLAALAVEEIERLARGEPFRYGITRADLERIA